MAKRVRSNLTASNTSTRDQFRIYLRRGHFVMCWWLVMLAHASAIAFLMAMVYLYFWLLSVPFAREGILSNISFDISYRTLSVMVSVFAGIAALHGYVLLANLYCSVKARELTFGDESAITKSFGHRWASGGCFGQCLQEQWQKWIVPVFYIHGRYFQQYFMAREYLEVISQVYQAYQMSFLISRGWINNCYVGNLFLNCLSTPLVHKLVPVTKEPLRRLIEVTCSAFLNFINSVVIPVVIFVPYVQAYDHQLRYFPVTITYNEVWYVSALRENQLLFVTSLVDFVFTATPHWGLWSCLRICEGLLRRKRKNKTSTNSITCNSVLPRTESRPPFRARDESDQVESITAATDKHLELVSWETRSVTGISSHRLMIFDHLLWIVGLVVLAIHMSAQTSKPLPGCRLDAHPWFAPNTSCVIMSVNCFHRGMEGKSDQIATALIGLNTKTLFQLILSHCSNLQIPPIIRSFEHLGGIDLYNVTLDQWSSEASLLQSHHPDLDYVDIVRSNMTSIPDGLLHDQLPQRLLEVHFFESNLSALPSSTNKYWRQLQFIGLEKCQFDHYPEYLLNQVSHVYFTGNPIERMDQDLFANEDLLVLYLSNSRLSALPNTTSGKMKHLFRLYLQQTNLSEIPMYIQEWFNAAQGNVDHTLVGSPYCHRQLDNDSFENDYQRQVCDPSRNDSLFHFAIDTVEQHRPIDQF